MAGKFEITKAGDTFSFELFIDDKAVGKSPVFDKEDACKRGVKAVKKNSRKLEGGSRISVKRKGGSKMIRNHVVSNLAATTAKRTSVCLVCRENG